jgi:hypothetical protein
MIPITPTQIRRILEVTDGLGIHREAITIPLAREGPGAVAVRGRKIEITAPADVPFDAWLEHLPQVIETLDLSNIQRIDPDED